MNFKYKFGVIGFGNMAKAIVLRAINMNVLGKKDVLLCDISKGQFDGVDTEIVTTTNVGEIVKNCEYIFLSTKPQSSGEIFQQIKKDICVHNIIISIMAGVSTQTIIEALGNKVENVIRCMPNTPCMIGEGMTAIAYGKASKEDISFIDSLFLLTGKVAYVDEKDINAVTSVSGSGPAYFYYFMNAIIEQGVKDGLSEDVAKKLAVQTCIGAGKMVEQSSDTIAQLIDKVCSKGGTTIEAITSFCQNNVAEKIQEGQNKCFLRAVELSEKK